MAAQVQLTHTGRVRLADTPGPVGLAAPAATSRASGALRVTGLRGALAGYRSTRVAQLRIVGIRHRVDANWKGVTGCSPMCCSMVTTKLSRPASMRDYRDRKVAGLR